MGTDVGKLGWSRDTPPASGRVSLTFNAFSCRFGAVFVSHLLFPSLSFFAAFVTVEMKRFAGAEDKG